MSSPDPRRRGRDVHSDDGAAAKRPRRGQKHRHLYLVMDDWEMGYSIHKLDVDAFEPTADAGGKLRRLPEPCALRIEAPADRNPAIVAALGSKIFLLTDRYSAEAPILIYDTDTASLAIGPLPTPALRPVGFIFLVPVADQRLFVFNPRRADPQCSFEVVSSAPRDDDDEFRLSRRAVRWSVSSVPAPMPLLRHELVTGYAVHPDGHTIFVSARNKSRLDGERKGGTHSFDSRSSEWAWHGEWQLPFRGQGCYVDELDAWVGLRGDGFLCSCAVPTRGGTAAPPEWKLGKETMFREDPERHVGQPGATLTYMGDGRFCIVECAARREVGVEEAMDGEVDGCVLHVSIFGVKYDKRGDLQTAAHRERSYIVSRYGPVFAAQTFWM
ncbi:unnamed protein product [Urochloa humidicola]